MFVNTLDFLVGINYLLYMRYKLSLPNKPDRILENIVFDKVFPKVEAMGGTLEPIREEQPKPTPAPIPATPILGKRVYTSYGVQMSEPYVQTWNDLLDICYEIKEKYFPALNERDIQFKLNNRFNKRLLGRAWYWRNKIELSARLLCERYAWSAKQVIFHELCHLEFPTEKHRGPNFRNKERNNPFRENKNARRLTCIG